MFRKLAFVSLFVLPMLWTSCRTDFSLNGEYEVTPIIFGLLDHKADVHIFKITKAYLGDGDNLEYAQNPDSSYFTSVDARIIEYIDGDKTGREWQLTDSIITGKDTSGVFYAPEQKVYVFYESDLDSSAEYHFVAYLNESTDSVTATTELIKGFSVSSQLYFTSYKINFASNTISDDTDYNSWIFTVSEGLHGSRYNYQYTLNWTEFYSDNTNQSFSATRNNGDKEQVNPDVPGGQSASFGGLDFYLWVRDIIPDDPDVIRRKIDGIDLQIAVAHENLDQYMDVAQPVSGIAQVQPEYTNINGGLGLFSSRVVLKLNNFRLDKSSMRQLCVGGYTSTKLFCSSFIEDAAESYYCP